MQIYGIFQKIAVVKFAIGKFAYSENPLYHSKYRPQYSLSYSFILGH